MSRHSAFLSLVLTLLSGRAAGSLVLFMNGRPGRRHDIVHECTALSRTGPATVLPRALPRLKLLTDGSGMARPSLGRGVSSYTPCLCACKLSSATFAGTATPASSEAARQRTRLVEWTLKSPCYVYGGPMESNKLTPLCLPSLFAGKPKSHKSGGSIKSRFNGSI